jgi:hypothetical protein
VKSIIDRGPRCDGAVVKSSCGFLRSTV